MVASVDDIFQIVRASPFIDGIGYFVEVTTKNAVPESTVEELTGRMQDDFCLHSQATLEGENVIGLDFHEHILTHGDEAEHEMNALEALMREIERRFGVEHLCIEFQFDLSEARKARRELDELLKP